MISDDDSIQKKRVGILGSGFGLYGYLPAVAHCGAECIILPERYRDNLLLRSELHRFQHLIHWVAEKKVLHESDTLIIARRPEDNHQIINALDGLYTPPNRTIILEKPISADPTTAKQILDISISHQWQLKVGFTFRWMQWAKKWFQLLNTTMCAQQDAPWQVRWSFLAHHYKYNLYNWKRFHTCGGGALRFYGIHLVALLSEWGYQNVVSSKITIDSDSGAPTWSARLTGPSLRNVDIDINTLSDQRVFDICCSDIVVHSGRDPFDQSIPLSPWSDVDHRCGLLAVLLTEKTTPDGHIMNRILATNRLWEAIENATTN